MAPLNDLPANVLKYITEEIEDDLPSVCLVCGNSPFFIGYIEKTNPTRMLIYCLCNECYEELEADITVNKIICYYEAKRKNIPGLTRHLRE